MKKRKHLRFHLLLGWLLLLSSSAVTLAAEGIQVRMQIDGMI